MFGFGRRKRRREAQDAAVVLVMMLSGRFARSMAGSRRVHLDLPTPEEAFLWVKLLGQLHAKESFKDARTLAILRDQRRRNA